MIRSGFILMIKDLARKGKSAYAIGQEIGISKNTARKYMEQADRQLKFLFYRNPFCEQYLTQAVSASARLCWYLLTAWYLRS